MFPSLPLLWTSNGLQVATPLRTEGRAMWYGEKYQAPTSCFPISTEVTFFDREKK